MTSRVDSVVPEISVSNLIKSLNNILAKRGDIDFKVTAVTQDSRTAGEGVLFTAIEGQHIDGHQFIGQALKSGSRAIVHQKDLDEYCDGVLYIQVANSRLALSRLSSSLYDNPSEKICVIGVTGTNGKSTVSLMIRTLLNLCGKRCGLISTVFHDTTGEVEPNPVHSTTPEAPFIHKSLAEMVKAGMEYAVIESSSHGLSPKTARLEDVSFFAGIFTNLTPEHLEFHGTMETYKEDKARLFAKCKGFGVVNAMDMASQTMRLKAGEAPVYDFALANSALKSQKADIVADKIEKTGNGNRFSFSVAGNTFEGELTIPGIFNVENVLAAMLAVHRLTGKSYRKLSPLLPQLKPPAGRMNFIDEGQDFSVIIDYAHSPGAFEVLLPGMKPHGTGKLIVLFGSAGERDKEKRPLQGRIADQYGDIVILTDEDPRGESSSAILEDIANGISRKERDKDLFLIPDREKAISFAIDRAESGDTLLLLGKGHENSIIQAQGERPWNEEAVVRRVLKKMVH